MYNGYAHPGPYGSPAHAGIDRDVLQVALPADGFPRTRGDRPW